MLEDTSGFRGIQFGNHILNPVSFFFPLMP